MHSMPYAAPAAPIGIAALLAAHADLPAFRRPGKSVTRAELLMASRRAARALFELGLQPGDAFAVWLPSGGIWLQLMLAAAQLGLLMVPIDPRERVIEARRAVRAARAKLVIVPGDSDEYNYLAAAKAMHELDGGLRWAAVNAGACFAWEQTAPLYASMGLPRDPLCAIAAQGIDMTRRLAVHSQGALVSHAAHVARNAGMNAGDAVLCAVPLHCALGQVQSLAALTAGAALVFASGPHAGAAAHAIQACGVTHLYASDDLLEGILETPGVALGRWRHGGVVEFSGRGRQVVAKAQARWGVALTGVYGRAESLGLAAMRRENDDVWIRAVPGGSPISDRIAFRVVDPCSGALLPDGVMGELQLRGYNVMEGYLDDPDATAKAMTGDGWLRTGDMAIADGSSFSHVPRLGRGPAWADVSPMASEPETAFAEPA